MSYTSRNPQFASTVLDDITTDTPTNPIAGKHKIVDRNGVLYIRDSAGNESLVSGLTDIDRGVNTYSNGQIVCSVDSNALTIALKGKDGNDPSSSNPVKIGFRSATSTDGSYIIRTITSALSMVVSSGSTLGTVSAVSSLLKVYAIDNAGTVVLGVINGGLSEEIVQSSTAEGGAGAADTAGVLYTTSAQTNKAVRCIANLLVTEVTAGTWATAPSNVAIIPVISSANIVGRTDGVAPAAGMVGSVIPFTSRSIATASSNVIRGGAAALATLTAGSWEIVWWQSCVGVPSIVACYSYIATNNDHDSTGLISQESDFVFNLSSGGWSVPCIQFVYNTTGQTIYSKCVTSGATSTVTVGGYAKRIA